MYHSLKTLAVLLLLLAPLPASALESVTLQLKWTHAFQFAGYYVAREKGFYREAGLDVTIREAQPGLDVPGTVLRDEAQYGVGTSSLLLERHAGKPLVVLAVIFQHSPLVLLARDTVSTQGVHDLVGKRIMLERQSDEIIAYLKQEGVPLERLRFIEHSFDPRDLIDGRADAISAYVTNERFYLEQAGFPYQTYTPRSAGIDFYGDNLFTSEREILEHPARVRAFREASLRGWQYAMAHPEEAIDLILAHYPTDHSRAFLAFEAQAMVPLLQPMLVEMGYMNPGRWRHIADTYAGLGMLPVDFPLDEFLYDSDPTLDPAWLYGGLGGALLALMVIGGVALYVYRTNRLLDQALAESRRAEEVIWNQANLDPLTNLPNRRMFRDRLEQEMKQADRSGKKLALIFLDLDHFKEVNDIHGHNQGDLLLTQVAQRLERCVREVDTVARLGGDEFTIILGGLDDPRSAERVAGTVLERLADPYQLELETSHISASIGITLYPDDSQDVDTLLKNADQAMYAAKASGRNRFHYFTTSMHLEALHRVQLVNDLRGALAAQQFQLVYQPIVELASGRIAKAETLIRWNHPIRGPVSPMEFIPVAEETGQIVEIGDWVFREATRQLSRWRRDFGTDLCLSVNTSPVQYQHGGETLMRWFDRLRELRLPGSSVIVEITEGMLMGSQAEITGQLLAFRDAGIQVALDDFGTGYSSLSYLNKFDIDYIKIDKSFVRNLAEGSNDLVLCQAIIIMAHKLGLRVVAEGVETEAQRRLLAAAGCDYAQGYLFSRPLPAREFASLLNQHGAPPEAGLRSPGRRQSVTQLKIVSETWPGLDPAAGAR